MPCSRSALEVRLPMASNVKLRSTTVLTPLLAWMALINPEALL